MSTSALLALRESDAGLRARWRPAIAVLAAAVAAVLIQSLWVPLDADVSWLITVCERVLGGDRLYIDIVEVNPPASVWLYLPPVWAAERLGLRPEAVVVASFVAAALFSTAFAARLLRRLRDSRPEFLIPAIAFVLLVLPMALFAQREHLALILAVPSLAALALIAEGKPLSRTEALAAGAMAGLIIVIKPPFALAIAAPAVWSAVRRRSVVPLLPGAAAALVIVVAYALAFVTLEPAYFPWLRVFGRTYLRMHEVWWKLFCGGIVLFPAIALALAAILRPVRMPPLAAMWALGAAGFCAAGLIQAKNYPNHWLPGGALALLAMLVLILLPHPDRKRRWFISEALMFLAIFEVRAATIFPDMKLVSLIEREAPPAPRMMELGSQLTTGHPATRLVGGHWVASRAGLFTAAGARFVGRDGPQVAAIYREDISSFAADVRKGRPDLILVDRPEKRWLMQEPEIRDAMAAFRPVAREGDTELWLRR